MSGVRKALVTGGAGFIGSHLVDRLLADSHEVIAIDNLANGRRQNLSSAMENPRFTFVEADVADFDAVRPAFDGVDWVFHLAALADIVPSIERPTDYFRANVVGTECVLEAARAAQVKRFIYAASSSCYGIPDRTPTPETAEIRPEYPYALTKNLGEQLVQHWGKVYGLPYISLRFFNVYGPRARTSGTYGAVFGVFLAQKLKGRPLTIVGDGTQTRDFTYVADVAAAIVRAAEREDVRDRILNVGSGGTYSVNRLVELLGGEKTYIPKRPGEPDCTFADTALIREVLGWEPQISFEDGVKKMLNHIRDWESAPVWTPETIQEATKVWFYNLSAKKS